MASTLPFVFRASPLPSDFVGTPQEFLDALVARLSAESEVEIAVFVTGSVEPSSNVGPWLKDGVTWYVWSDVTGDYVPQTIEPESLGYTIGSVTPDQNVYRFWIETDGAGSPLALKIYYSGSWVDVYATKLAAYMTTSAFNAAIASYSTTAQMNSAISAAIAGIPPSEPFEAYPAQAELSSGPQILAINNTPQKCTLNMAPINPSPAPWDTTLFRYVAPAAGKYSVSVVCKFDNDTGTPASMQTKISVYVNGADTGVEDTDNTPSPNGGRWSPTIGGQMFQLDEDDYVEIFATITDGVDSGNMELTSIDVSVWRISA